MSVEVNRDSVRCVIEDEATEVSDDEDGGTRLADSELASTRFGYDSTAAITRVTGQRVIAFIPKRDRKTQVVTQTYILDRPRQRF